MHRRRVQFRPDAAAPSHGGDTAGRAREPVRGGTPFLPAWPDEGRHQPRRSRARHQGQAARGANLRCGGCGSPAFTTLVAAVTCPGFDGAIATALSATGQRTVFAPTNVAFAKLGLNAGNVCAALPLATLQDILLYHVAPGARLAADVVASETIRMANGERTTITVNAEGAFINQSRITATDIVASNGVIHVIDTVLLPPSR